MELSELIIKAFSVQADRLLCPVCSADDCDKPEQPMCAMGDYPGMLFCPHCELAITFSQPALDRPNRTIWIRRCLKKFIERFKK